MAERRRQGNIPPEADLAIPFLDRVLAGGHFPPIAILLPRSFGMYDDNKFTLEVTAATTTGDIHVVKQEFERYRFGISPYYRPNDRIYLCIDLWDFFLPYAGTWRFQIKGYTVVDLKKTTVLNIHHDEVTEAVLREN
ncbi:hypothetical protein B0T20DRAFT_466744 [Sordaria brevicollis]|uniref:Uncharacterized protein n=1 Tax=Sordaria brevicollis TaxID=83679 RepID=A0AAE0PL00_SORBR|nr:hypothetical protein B0T20DRAFT_466744 [Sordaria brevicollis]